MPEITDKLNTFSESHCGMSQCYRVGKVGTEFKVRISDSFDMFQEQVAKEK